MENRRIVKNLLTETISKLKNINSTLEDAKSYADMAKSAGDYDDAKSYAGYSKTYIEEACEEVDKLITRIYDDYYDI